MDKRAYELAFFVWRKYTEATMQIAPVTKAKLIGSPKKLKPKMALNKILVEPVIAPEIAETYR